MKWEALPLADRAKLMAAAVRNGYTDIRSIKEAYANYLNLKQSAGNRYAKGGDTDEPEVVNLLDKLPIWKALEKIDYIAIPDENFTKDKTGIGDIEYFNADYPEGTTYPNGYHRDHPMPGKDVILYNPNNNDEQDIRLDALHIMRQRDPIYDALHANLTRAAKDLGGDIVGDAKYWQKIDRGVNQLRRVTDQALRPEVYEEEYYVDPINQYVDNEVDGFLRSILMEGDSKYREEKGYIANKSDLIRHNKDLMPYVNDIQQYLKTGERPPYVLPNLEVADQLTYGGNLFKTGGNKKSKKKSWQQELQERRDYYRQQLIIRGLRGAQLEAVLANMEVESGFNPDNVNPYSGAKGLMQWLGSRKPKSWSEKDQLDYIAATYNKFGGNKWLDKAAWKRFNETTDPAEAARLFRRYWERPEKSSWYATDALFKNSNSYLPKETNDLIKQVASLEYNGPKEPRRPVFTEADLRLLDSPILASHNVDYDNYESPDYQESPLMLSIKLNPAYDEPDNPLALYNMLASLLLESALNDPYNWMSALMTVSPKTTPEQKQAANWLFNMTSDGGLLYHGLNFAAYGGKVNKFETGGPYSDEFMNNYGYKWAPASQILLSDPYFRDIQQHDPNGTYAVDLDGYYIPASRLKDEWQNYNRRNNVNGPATAVDLPEVEYQFSPKDQRAINIAKRLWGNNIFYGYRDMSDMNSTFFNDTFDRLDVDEPEYTYEEFSPNDMLYKLDTLTLHSTTPKLHMNPISNWYHKRNSKRGIQPDGRLRAYTKPWKKDAPIWLDEDGKKFLTEWLSEFAHTYQFNAKDKDLVPYNLIGAEPEDVGVDNYEASYHIPGLLEYNAHNRIEDEILWYLLYNDTNYSEFKDYLKDGFPTQPNKSALQWYFLTNNQAKAAAAGSKVKPVNKHDLGGFLGDPLVRTANNLFNDGGFYNLPEQRAYERAVNLKAPFTNYEDAVDMDDSIMLRLKKFFDKGVSNCTLTASQLLNPNRPIGRARTIVTDSLNNGFYEVDSEHIVPGTMVIASHPNMSDYSPEQNYHTMVVTGFAPKDYEYTFRDGTKYQIKKGEPLVSYSRGKASADNYVHDIPLSVYNDKSEGKTYNRYYRPIDENYPQVMLPEITFTK